MEGVLGLMVLHHCEGTPVRVFFVYGDAGTEVEVWDDRKELAPPSARDPLGGTQRTGRVVREPRPAFGSRRPAYAYPREPGGH